jgi:hypothetical protein
MESFVISIIGAGILFVIFFAIYILQINNEHKKQDKK